MKPFTAHALFRGRPLGIYTTWAKTRGDAIMNMQRDIARDYKLNRTDAALITLEFA